MNIDSLEIIDQSRSLYRYQGEELKDVLVLSERTNETLFLNLDDYKIFKLNTTNLRIVPDIFREKKNDFKFSYDFLTNRLLSRYRLHVINETVTNIDLDLNFKSRSLLNNIRGNLDNNKLEILSKIDYPNRYNYKIAFLKAYESIQGITISDRIATVRMFYLEFSRILNHLYNFSDLAYFLECNTLKNKLIQLIKRINNLLDTFDKDQFLNFKGDLIIDSEQIVNAFILSKDIERVLVKIKRLVKSPGKELYYLDIGKIDSVLAIKFGITGVTLRASGINYDIRKHRPYYFFKEMLYDVPLGVNGSVLDRYTVRLEEIRESLKIIAQLCANIPSGNATTFKDSSVSNYVAIDTAKGELGVILNCHNQEITNLEFTNPSKSLFLVLSELKDFNINDFELIEKSLDISYGELEK